MKTKATKRPEFALRPLDLKRDAPALARMWMESDDQWPGTWSGGIEITPTMIQEWLEREGALEISVWDTGDGIAGYCSFWKDLEEPETAYIALLNVSPKFQKRSLARKFLTHYVERAAELGFTRLDLHTWASNIKAVPLYKKTGFAWMPDTSVHMLNFIPGIIRMPLAKDFFEKHHWYSCFKRILDQTEDDDRWRGMKVFKYHFEKDGDFVTVWADREGRRLSAFENNDVLIAALAPDLEPPRGLPAKLTWECRNKSDRPMEVTLIATGSEHLQIDHRDSAVVAPGTTTRFDAEVEVASKIPERLVRKGHPAPLVKSLVILDGHVCELGTGLRPRHAIEVSTHPRPLTLTPGKRRTVTLQLRNRLSRPVDADLSLIPDEGLQTSWSGKKVRIPAQGFAGLRLDLEGEAGVKKLSVPAAMEVDGRRVETDSEPQRIFVLPLGGVLGDRSQGSIRIENERFRLRLDEEGAAVHLSDRVSGRHLGFEQGLASPPVKPSEYWAGIFDLELKEEKGSLVAVASMASKKNRGFVLSKRVEVNGGPIVKISYQFENRSSNAQRLQVMQSIHGPQVAESVVPLRGRIASGPSTDFPGPSDDQFKKPSNFAEPWAAVEGEHETVGVIWPADTEEIEQSWGWVRHSEFYECAAHGTVSTEPLHIYIGDGGWRAVQNAWRRVVGQELDDPEFESQPEPYMNARLDPPLAAATDGDVAVDLVIERGTARKLDAKAKLALPRGWKAERSSFDLSGLTWQTPFREKLYLKAPARTGAATGRVEIRSDEIDRDFEIPLVKLGGEGLVEVVRQDDSDMEVFTVSNGAINFRVAPSFGAALFSLREGRCEHLLSSFPTPGAFGFSSPWFGGASPQLQVGSVPWPGKLHTEKFEAEPTRSKDRLGIGWEGVRQRSRLKAEDAKGLAIQLDTLTTAGSPVIKLVLGVTNSTSAVRTLGAGWSLYLQPDGESGKTLLVSEKEEMKPRPRVTWRTAGHWGFAQNPTTGRGIVMVADRLDVVLVSWGVDGNHLLWMPTLNVGAKRTVSITSYLAIASSVDEARALAALRHI